MEKHGQPTVHVKLSAIYAKACSPKWKAGFFILYQMTLIFF